jgi:hypothetical protein
MIAAEVKTPPFIQESDKTEWCLGVIGPRAEFRDQVSDEYPWTYNHTHGYSIWYFAREEYATMFRLRWL